LVSDHTADLTLDGSQHDSLNLTTGLIARVHGREPGPVDQRSRALQLFCPSGRNLRRDVPRTRHGHKSSREDVEALGVRFVFALAASLVPMPAAAQRARLGGHDAGRPSDTGVAGMVSPTGRSQASVPLDLPAARGGLPIPLGAGWREIQGASASPGGTTDLLSEHCIGTCSVVDTDCICCKLSKISTPAMLSVNSWNDIQCRPIGTSQSVARPASVRRFVCKLSFAVVVSLCISACSSEGRDGQTDAVNQAVTADWIHPGCEAVSLGPPSNDPQRCNGPWTYDYQEWWKNSTACGNSTTCAAYNTCTSWDRDGSGDGLGFTTQDLTSSAVHTQFCPGGTPRRPCTNLPSSVCPADATAWRAQLKATRPGMSAAADAGFIVSWTATNISVETDPDPSPGGGPHASTTTYSCDLVAHNYPTERSDARPACGCAQFVPSECVRSGPTAVFTAPGAVMPTSPGAPSAGSTRREFVAAPQCTTCDRTALTDPTNAQAAFGCLDAMLVHMHGISTTGPTADIIASVAGRMELLLQIAADKLTIDQRARGEQIYNEEPAGMPACRAPIAWAPDCQTEATPFALPGQLQLCQDLVSNPSSSRTIAGLELAHCLTQLRTVDQLTTPGCRLATRDAADVAVRGVLSRAQPDYTSDLAIALPIAMTQINTWWSAASVVARGDTSWLVEHASEVTHSFWSALEQAKVPLPAPGIDDDQVGTLLADIGGIGLDDDIAVISALFDDTQDSTSPVLLTLTGDALRGLEDRLIRLEAIHDVGCRFAACKSSTGLRSSAVSELVHALAALADPAKLGTVLASASKLQQQKAALHAALGRMRAHHTRLSTAWTALGRSEPFSALAQVVDPPAETAMLAKIVSEASLAWASYESTGEFAPSHRPRLTAATLEQNDVIANLDTLITAATTAKNTFSSQRQSTVNDILTQVQNHATQQSVQDRNAELRVQLRDVISRSLGLEAREASDRAQLAKFQQAFEAIAGSLDPNAVFQATTLPQGAPPLRVSAADAHHTMNASLDLAHDRFHVETLNVGEALRIHVTGAWSPTCAIGNAVLVNPSNGVLTKINIPTAAATGPTGYWASYDNNTYHANTESLGFDNRLNIGASAEACTGTAGEGVFGSGAKACVHINIDKTWTASESGADGTQARQSASFTSGIRLPSTPLKVAPAGSLVAVITRANSPIDIIDVRVVQSDDLIVAPDPGVGNAVDVHLVVNDGIGAGCTPDTANQLQLDMVKTVPEGVVARLLGPAMSQTLTAIEAEAPAILAQGQLSADEATSLRSGAWLRLQQALPQGLGLAGLPSDLHQLFEAFVDQEIASIGRRGEMHAASLQEQQVLLELAANADELGFAEQEGRLLFLIPRWRLRDLSGVDLAQTTEALAQSLSAYVAPIFELRDPARYTSFPAQVSGQLSLLIDLPLTGALEDQVSKLVAFAQTARDAVSAATFELPATFRRTIVIAIPRPPTTTVPHPISPPWQQVPTAAAKAFWNSAFDGNGRLSHSATITLSPSDLYVFGGSQATLACSDIQSDLAPVVRRAAVYLDTASPPSNQLGIELPARAAGTRDVTFPLVHHLTTLAPDDARGIPLSLPVLVGSASEALDKFSPSGGPDQGLGAGAGLSPFTSFELDMTSLGSSNVQDVWNSTQALYLMFEVERNVSLDPAWVEGVCVMREP
jgi:hypothetical protein